MATCISNFGQWRCLDCGTTFRNNAESYQHESSRPSHGQRWFCLEHNAYEGRTYWRDGTKANSNA